MKVGELGGVASREDRVRDSTQRHAIEEEARTAADDEILRASRRPCEAQTRRDIVRVCADRLQELQVVAKSEVQREARPRTPFVLRVHTAVWIRLRNDGSAKRLRVAA